MKIYTISSVLLVSVLCAMFIVIPQVNVESYVNSTITSKFIYFSCICMVLVSTYGLVLLTNKKISHSFTRFDILLFILFMYISINRYYIQDHYGFSIRYMELLGLSIVYVILRSVSVTNYIWLLLAIIISGSIQAVYGNLQLLGYYPSNHSGFKMTGSFFNPGPYTGFLASVWPLALGVYLFRKQLFTIINLKQITTSKLITSFIKYVLEYVPLIGLISIALVLPASQSRAAWLAVSASSFLLLESRYRILRKLLDKLNSLKIIILGVLTVVIISIAFLGVYHFKKGSSDGRLFIWKVTANMIYDTPVFGVGFDRFKAHYMNYQADYFKVYGETNEAFVADNTYYTFNEFLQFFAENGVIGFLILTLILYTLIKVSVNKEHKELYVIAMGTLLSIAIFASFSYPMQILPIKMILIFTLSLITCLDTRKIYLNFSNHVKIIYKTVSLVTLGGVIFMVTTQVKYIKILKQSFKTWQDALTIYNYGDYQGSLELFKQVKPVLYNNGGFLTNYGKALTMANQNQKAVKVIEDAKQYVNTTVLQTALGDAYKDLKQHDKAETAYKNAYNMIPTRFYPLYLLANLYKETEQNKKARNMAENILSKEIKIPSTAINEIQTEMKKILEKQNK